MRGGVHRDGKWFHDRSVPGDVIEATGSTRGTVAVGNGCGDWNPDFAQWRRLSALDRPSGGRP
ncbi:hypothetical protein [Streptomyces sp. URMC 125]|uniref:hypothetical protein n=1 Tax=Streptomyces sp. URMC 125 TaxID=3423419 RepID=UPI003F1BBC4D